MMLYKSTTKKLVQATKEPEKSKTYNKINSNEKIKSKTRQTTSHMEQNILLV